MASMRILLALALLVAAVVVLLALLPSRSSPSTVEPVAVGPVEPAPSAPLDLVPSETRTQRADPTVDAARDPDATSASIPTCRVEIALVSVEGVYLAPTDVHCFDGAGATLRADKVDTTSWIVPEANPGDFHVEVRPLVDWIPAGTSFVIAPGETSKRVEVRLRPAHALRVRWQATDGRPIVTALRDAGVLDSPAILSLVLDTEPVSAGEPRPPSSSFFTLTVDPDEVASEDDSAEAIWTDAPADAFALLSLPVDPPCAVHACIGGLVVESASVLPGTREIVFRTDLDAVRGFSTTVRFCLVASETRAAFGGAGFSAASEWGATFDRIHLGADGCRVETRLPPGEWTLLFDHPGRAPHAHKIALAPGADLDLGQIALAPDCPLSVRLLHPDGSAASDLIALLQPLDGPRRTDAMSGANERKGVFTFANVPDEPLVLVLLENPEWSAAPLLVEPCGASGSRAEITLQLETATAVVLDFGPTTPLAPPILVTDANGLPAARREIGLAGAVRLRLVPGEYRVARPGIPGAHAFTVGRESVVIEIR